MVGEDVGGGGGGGGTDCRECSRVKRMLSTLLVAMAA